MTAGRPVGKRIRQVCQILQNHGSNGIRRIQHHMPEVQATNISKYCRRAEAMGLVTRKLNDDGFAVYTVKPNWEALIDEDSESPLRHQPEPDKPTKWTGISSIFQLGELK